MTPQIITVQHRSDIDRFVANHQCTIKDLYTPLAKELFEATHVGERYSESPHQLNQGAWVYLPWIKTLYHLLSPDQYYDLRTVRNRNVITPAEQNHLHHTTISIAGLSVGKNTLLSLVRYGIGQHFRVAEMDTFELSNMNRANYDLLDYQQPKLDTTLHQLWQLDPFLTVDAYPQGLSESNLASFVSGSSLIVDTFDHFPTKLALRQSAKKLGIPVVSGADLEKGVLVTVERYDTEPDLTLDLYLNHQDPARLKQSNVTKQDITNFFINLIGKELHSPRMYASVMEVGKTLTSYPQLIVASQLFASCLTVAAEAILLNHPLPSGRHHLDIPTSLHLKPVN